MATRKTAADADIEALVEQGAATEIERLRYNLTCIVNADVRKLYNPDTGEMLKPHQWPDDMIPAIKTVRASSRQNGDPTIEFQDRNAAVTQLAKLGNLYKPPDKEPQHENPLEAQLAHLPREDLKLMRTMLAKMGGRTVTKVAKKKRAKPRSTKPNANAERDAEICRLYESGEPSTKIAPMFDITPGAVIKVLNNAGVTIRKQGRNSNGSFAETAVPA